MTPKEKAEELYNNMLEKMPHPDVTNANVYSIVKQCALIAVDEILKIVNLEFPDNCETVDIFLYWQKVKREIEKL